MSTIMDVITVTLISASIMSAIDITLTYYILWMDKKLHGKAVKWTELNIIAAFIMKLTNNGPWGLLFGCLQAQTLIWGGTYLILRYAHPIQALVMTSVLIGALTTVIWIHMHSITQLHKMYKSKKIIAEALDDNILETKKE